MTAMTTILGAGGPIGNQLAKILAAMPRRLIGSTEISLVPSFRSELNLKRPLNYPGRPGNDRIAGAREYRSVDGIELVKQISD